MKFARFHFVFLILVAIAGFMLSHSTTANAAGGDSQVRLNVSNAVPREIEDATEQAVQRDYGKAWQAMIAARDQNRPDLLGAMFVGIARTELEQAIEDQQKSGLHVRYVDHGHQLQAVFYSQEGSALQLRDTARLEMQLVDGDAVVHSEDATVDYIVLMTPAADHWQVRMLQAVPNF